MYMSLFHNYQYLSTEFKYILYNLFHNFSHFSCF